MDAPDPGSAAGAPSSREDLAAPAPIVDVRWQRFRLGLRRPLATAHGVLAQREGVLVRLRDARGRVGLGETMPLPGFHRDTADGVVARLPAVSARLLGADAARLSANLDRLAGAPPAVAACLDLALHDLAGRCLGRPVAGLLAEGEKARRRGLAGGGTAGAAPAAGRWARAVTVATLVAGDAPHEVAAAAQALRARGFRSFKLKLGGRALAHDVERVAALRLTLGWEAAIRLDANGGWSEDEAREALDRLAVFAPELVEQPVAADDLPALARLRGDAAVRIAADEAVRSPARARAILDAGAADALVVKPAALGGLRPAARIAALAHRAGVEVVVTGFLDSAIGTAAALHLAASLPPPRAAAGLATDGMLERDLAALPPVSAGRRALPPGAGLGVALAEGSS